MKHKRNAKTIAKTVQQDEDSEEYEQSAEEVLRQAEDDMGIPPGTLDSCMDSD